MVRSLVLLLILVVYTSNGYAQKKGTIHVKKTTKEIHVRIVGKKQDVLYANQPNSFEIVFSEKCKDAKVLMEGVRFTSKGKMYTFTPLNQRNIVLICICNGIEIYRKSYPVINDPNLVDSVGWGK